MKPLLSISCSQDHCADPERIIFSSVYRDLKVMHFEQSRVKISQNHTSNLDEVFLKLPPSSDFGLEARILQIGWIHRPKWKKVEKSASKNKHPIKLRFLIWRLQSANPEKKVIPENQEFGSCPLYVFQINPRMRNLIPCRVFEKTHLRMDLRKGTKTWFWS